ncbi:c-type cytochrome [Microvirga sp. GCM10011540]|uniref:c-type cytochrome n=1 Tax=Microvirga sp. GCM10011540 TaxID=3317338 RepID=UPI00361F2B03
MPLLLREWRKKPCRALAAASLFMLAACNEGSNSQDTYSQDYNPDLQRIVGGDPERGRRVIASYECGACHTIPGIQGAHGIVGPPLTKFARRQLIGGVVPNQPTLLIRWVQDAPSLIPQTGMPDLGLTDDEARDAASYLYTLR